MSKKLSTHINNGLIVLFLAPFFMSGAPSAIQTLDNLLIQSDTVLIGKVIQGTVLNQNVLLSIEVERRLLGSSIQDSIISVNASLTEPSPGVRNIYSIRGLFFISHKDAHPTLVPLRTGAISDEYKTFIPLPERSTPTLVGDSIKDNVLLEILAAVSVGFPKRTAGMIDLPYELLRNQTSKVKSALKPYQDSELGQLKALSIGIFASEGDLDTLFELETDDNFRKSTFSTIFVDQIKFHFKSTNPNSVSSLGRISTNEKIDINLRIAAASGLARVHTVEALPYLAQLLESSDPQLKTLAVGGLSKFANNVQPGESSPANIKWKFRNQETIEHATMDAKLIQQNESYYIDYWKSWWYTNRDSIKD